MAAVFWLLVLGAGVVTGQPWAYLILAVLLICLGLARSERPVKVAAAPPPRSVEAPHPAAPAPVAVDPWDEARRLKRQWREGDHKSWDEDFNRLLDETN